MIRTFRVNLLSLFIALLCGASLVSAEDLISEGTGYGVSKNAAVAKAKQDALAKGIGQFLSSTTEVENFMVKKDLVITRTMGHVKKVKILSESQGPDGVWTVKIRATVAKDGLMEDLQAMMILRDAIGNPRMAMLIQETNMDQKVLGTQKSETMLIDFFKKKSFEVVDPSYALKFRESPEGIQAMAGNAEAAASLGQELNAEVIIVGTVIAKASDVSQIKAFANSGMKSASAVISLKAVNVHNRRIIAAKTLDAPAVHVNQATAGSRAIEQAMKKMLNEKNGFFDSMVKAWKASANDGALFDLTVTGVSSFKQAKAVKKAMQKKYPDMKQRSFSKPKLKMETKFMGSVEDLCEQLDGLKADSKTLSVEACQGNTITLSIK